MLARAPRREHQGSRRGNPAAPRARAERAWGRCRHGRLLPPARLVVGQGFRAILDRVEDRAPRTVVW